MYRTIATIAMSSLALTAQANQTSREEQCSTYRYMYDVRGLDLNGADQYAISVLQSGADIGKFYRMVEERGSSFDQGMTGSPATQKDHALSNYTVNLPHATQPSVCPLEKALLESYLSRPTSPRFAKFLAIYHLNQSLLQKSRVTESGDAFKHTVIAQYFLNRAKELGGEEGWVNSSLKKTQAEIEKRLAVGDMPTTEETHTAHKYFYETFNYHEENRYVAAQELYGDFVNQPKNVFTSFLINAVNLWIGGEGDYDDPTVIYNFILGGFFSVHTMDLAKELETSWKKDPAHATRFRLASILGGFSVLHRRWLATLHGDQEAVNFLVMS